MKNDKPISSLVTVMIEARLGITLMLATAFAVPVLTAALRGDRTAASALFFYAVAIVVAWFVVGFIVAAFSSPGPIASDNEDEHIEA